MELIVFYHHPKTGGSSVRKSIEEVFTPDEMLFCYGKYAGESSVIPDLLAIDNMELDDYWLDVDQRLADPQTKVLLGHLVPPCDRVTTRTARKFGMLRHPYTRWISLYNHIARQQQRLGKIMYGFDEFVENFELRHELVDLNDFERLFFYERYCEALAALSEVLGRKLTQSWAHVSDMYLHRSIETDRLVEKHRAANIEQYEQAVEMFG